MKGLKRGRADAEDDDADLLNDDDSDGGVPAKKAR